MNRDYSTLELVQHDKTAIAPELDHDATTFDLDPMAPQVVTDTSPQAFYRTSLPEAYGNNKGLTGEHAPKLGIIKPRLKWLIVVVAFIIAMAIAIGVGVGIWRHRQLSSHFISEDTSLAAVIFANGDRQLFYQDNSGSFRRVARTPASGQWYTSSVLDSNCNPKHLTPLAVTSIVGRNGFPPQITLYYVSENNVLSQCSSKNSAEGIVWYTNPTKYSTAVGTRSLSVTTTNVFPANSGIAANTTASGSDTNSTTVYLLFYENPTGEVSALLQRVSSIINPAATQWVDITSQEVSSLPDGFHDRRGDLYSHTLHESVANAEFNAPFASRANLDAHPAAPDRQPPFGFLFYSRLNASAGTLFGVNITIGPSGPGNFSADYAQGLSSDSAINKSDIALFSDYFAMWINGTLPTLIPISAPAGFKASMPNNTFPFARLATLADNSSTYLYHQMNGDSFAEEQWYNAGDSWGPSQRIIV